MTDRRLSALQFRIHEIIFEADTPPGRLFDVILIGLILLSVLVVMLESVTPIATQYGTWIRAAEWGFTIIFTIEYVVRLLVVQHPGRYAVSFFGIVDLLAILPTYLSVLLPGGQALLSVRALRLLRVFRVLKLGHHVQAARVITAAMRASAPKLTVFIATVITMVTILGSAMYLVEGPANGYTSIPRSIYWAVVTLTTVGYGDISPQTPVGQLLATFAMLIGYAIIAVPTGIVSVELATISRQVSTQACLGCGRTGHDPDASHCKFCGAAI